MDDSGKTLAVLSGEISMSKAQTGVYLAGKLPTEAFIVALVRATVRPELRGRRQEEALTLREQAVCPAPRNKPGIPDPGRAGSGPGYAVELAAAQARQIETYDRLTRTLEQRAEVERAKNNSDKLVMVLLNMIHQLDRRLNDLAKERDQLLNRPRSEALEDAERKLARAEEQEQRARAELRRAEEKQRQAETLEARVTDELRRLTDELDRLRAADTTSPISTLPALPDEPEAGPVSADPVGDDIDAVLARASEVNDEDNTTLNRVTSELGEPSAGVVQDSPPDNLTSADLLEARLSHAEEVADAGNYERAVALFKELLPDVNRAFGTDHPDTLTTRHNHALNVGNAGNYQRAVTLLDGLLPDVTRVLGTDHPDTLTTRHNHALNVGKTGEQEGALLLLDELIADCTRALDRDHPITLNTRHVHAVLVGQAVEQEKALLLLDELVTDCTHALGPDHPDTLNSRQSLAVCVREVGDLEQAITQLDELLADCTHALGPVHPDTLRARFNHAVCVRRAGAPERAVILFDLLLADYDRTLSPDHPDTLRARAYRRRWL
ncbi:tetratricopeptide repeat protein [Streptomyces microflavus]|uniref:tetratricopeptide repeat protein n=1 Tax=Streptomyces microflavus TaxID=1919 RepID=UPI00332C5B2B